jgi:hypothetical protein
LPRSRTPVRQLPRRAALVLLLAARAAALSAQLPPSELGPLDTSKPITYFIADGGRRTGFEPGDRQLAQWALEAWRRQAPRSIAIEPSPESSALLRIYWAAPGQGQYGETQALMVDGRRGAALFIHPDMGSLGEDIAVRAGIDHLLRDAIVYLTCLHELGHAFGLAHTASFADIMYSFQYGGNIVNYFERYRQQIHARDDIAKVSGLSDADVARFRRLYQ